jgi:hypothetical protein
MIKSKTSNRWHYLCALPDMTPFEKEKISRFLGSFNPLTGKLHMHFNSRKSILDTSYFSKYVSFWYKILVLAAYVKIIAI